MNYNNSRLEHNKDILWNAAPDAIFDADSQGKLSVISDWNVFGRLWKWIKDLRGTVSERIHTAVHQTLTDIQALNDTGRLIYFKYRKPTSCFPFRRSHTTNELSYPADYLAAKMQKRFANVTSIQNIAQDMLDQKNQYPRPPISILDDDNGRDRRVLSPEQVD